MALYCGPPKFFKVIQDHELQNGELVSFFLSSLSMFCFGITMLLFVSTLSCFVASLLFISNIYIYMLQRVPKKFVEKYWNGIPNPVVVTLPNGIQQELFWVKRDDGVVLFRKNWKKIVKFLKFGYLVVFKYVGGSCFQLDIFGRNCVEIDYSKFIDQVKKEAEFVEVVDDEAEFAGTSRRTKRGT
jgi:hypothetical protein